MRVKSRSGVTSGLLGRLARARDGGVAMMFALALPPVCMMAVCGVDIHRASTVRAQLQDALDAAALAAARSNETTDAGIRTVGMRALRANLANFPDVTLREAASYTDFDLNADGSVTARARADVDALVADMFLGDMMAVGVESTVFRSNNRVEVALVIDNTGSMSSGGKLRAAQQAAANLVNRLAAADARSVEDDAVRISLVPFSMTVRAHSGFSSTGNRTGASNLGWLSRSTSHTGSTGSTGIFSTGQDRFAILDTLRIGWGGCVESRPYPYDVQDTPPSSGNQATMFVPYFAPDSPDRGDIPGDNTWQNYSYSNDYLDDAQSARNNNWSFSNNAARLTEWSTRTRDVTKYARNRLRSGIGTNLGPNDGCGLEPITRLTDNYNALLTSIWNMQATGETNVPMGLMWGWHTLSPRAPFADGRPYGSPRLQKIVILLTDGDNVNSTANNPDNSNYSGLGLIWQERLGADRSTASSATQRGQRMDERLIELCANMRAQEIIIFTVGVQVSTTSQNLLRQCANDDDRFYNVTNTSGIETAFDRIAGSIENLRIAR